MTDLATRPGADDASVDDAPTVALDTAPPEGGVPDYRWAPIGPAPRKRRTGLWIAVGAAVVVVALVVSSFVLIAPGTAIAGVQVGALTPGAAAEAVSGRLADTEVVLTGPGGDVVVTGAELGAHVDARALAQAAHDAHPMWNPTTWFPESSSAVVTVDEDAATAALRRAVPSLYVDPVEAAVSYDAAAQTYRTTPGEDGQGIDVAAVRAALQRAFDEGITRVEYSPAVAVVQPSITTEAADATVTTLNRMLDTAGFYVGKERTAPIDRDTLASWITVTADDEGLRIGADETAIQSVVDTLPASVDRAPVNGTVITDSAGKKLATGKKSRNGRSLTVTTGIAAAFAAQLAGGDAAFALQVDVVPAKTVALARTIEVDISSQRAFLFENGKVVESYYISSGLYGHDTDLGRFRIYAKVALQNMGDKELKKADYYTPNVPWISYYNGDEALHGAYWHNNFGNRMSHGCVNMPISAAKYVYDWAPVGTEVWVHL